MLGWPAIFAVPENLQRARKPERNREGASHERHAEPKEAVWSDPDWQAECGEHTGGNIGRSAQLISEHAAKHPNRPVQRGRPKKHPGNNDAREGDQPTQHARCCPSRLSFGAPQFPPEMVGYEASPMRR